MTCQWWWWKHLLENNNNNNIYIYIYMYISSSSSSSSTTSLTSISIISIIMNNIFVWWNSKYVKWMIYIWSVYIMIDVIMMMVYVFVMMLIVYEWYDDMLMISMDMCLLSEKWHSVTVRLVYKCVALIFSLRFQFIYTSFLDNYQYGFGTNSYW
jgi:hypothetical protein